MIWGTWVPVPVVLPGSGRAYLRCRVETCSLGQGVRLKGQVLGRITRADHGFLTPALWYSRNATQFHLLFVTGGNLCMRVEHRRSE